MLTPPVALAVVITGLTWVAARDAVAADPVVSALWGAAGERFDPAARLPDVSYAGYANGASDPPTVPVVIDATDFGANGSDSRDDTPALQKALDAARNGAVFLPAGQYRLERPLRMSHSHVVLRGAGIGKTILLPQTPTDLLMGVSPSERDGNYGRTAYVEIVGVASPKFPARPKERGRRLGRIVTGAKRGDTMLRVADATNLVAGRKVRLRMRNPPNNSFGCYIYGGEICMAPNDDRYVERRDVDWVIGIASIRGRTIELERPLRLDVRAEWEPELWSYAPSIERSGIENLTIRFPSEPFTRHHREPGWHAVWIGDADECWVRDVEILDADRGIEVTRGNRIYIGNVRLADPYRDTVADPADSEPRYGTVTGHYGISFNTFTQDSLAEKIRIDARFIHALSLASFANGNVYSSITARTATFDHHGTAPYDNVYTDIVITDDASITFQTGGAQPAGGIGSTFWNIRRASEATPDFPSGVGTKVFPVANFIGVGTWPEASDVTRGQWIESQVTFPANLYEAQLAKRLGCRETCPSPRETAP